MATYAELAEGDKCYVAVGLDGIPRFRVVKYAGKIGDDGGVVVKDSQGEMILVREEDVYTDVGEVFLRMEDMLKKGREFMMDRFRPSTGHLATRAQHRALLTRVQKLEKLVELLMETRGDNLEDGDK